MVEIVLVLAAPVLGAVLLALVGHRETAPAVNVAASLLLAVAHWLNFRAVRRAHNHHF